MNPPCTVMVEKILPEMRKRVAKRLKENGWAQSEIAKAVGVSQPMVSRYLSSEIEGFSKEIDKKMEEAIEEIVNVMLSGGTEPEIISIICDFCFYTREAGLLCELHPVEGCRVCMNLRSGGKAMERRKLMDEFMGALRVLEGKISPKLIPEVRINLAAALPNARRKEEVLAVPGRLVEIKGELKALMEPEFGASRHMSEILLKSMESRKDVGAVVNIAFNDDVRRALDSLGMRYREFDGESIPEGWDSYCLLDSGGYGREPCLYIFGKNSVEVAEKVRKIEKEVEN
jgi:predicted fused transcriptional regulator/phosphomethylpyrimidine kinase/predicted transcriptional regulator